MCILSFSVTMILKIQDHTLDTEMSTAVQGHHYHNYIMYDAFDDVFL